MATAGLSRDASKHSVPVAKPARVVVELHRHTDFSFVRSIVPLPCGNRVAIGSGDGKMRVYSTSSGALKRKLEAHSRHGAWTGVHALCALGGDVIASSGGMDGKVVTWNVATGARLCAATVAASSDDGVSAVASLGVGRFAAGTRGGDVVLFAHTDGRDVTETARVSRAHAEPIYDFAARGGRLATASRERTAAVWDVALLERLATLRGHTDAVKAVDMSDRLVVTGSNDDTVRVYAASGGYQCVAVLDWLHSKFVNFVKFISDDVVVSAALDGSVCVTQVSTRAVVARVKAECIIVGAAILADGRLAVCGNGSPALIELPAAAADAFESYGADAYPDSTAQARALVVAELLPPLQDSIARVVAGDLSAAVSCRDLISERACSASLPEWWAAHVLLMRAVQDGDVPAKTEYKGEENWWFRCLYAHAHKLVVGEKSRASVLKCVQDACTAGVLEATESTVAAIVARQDLKEEVAVLRSAEEQIVSAVGQVFMRQANTDRRLTEHMAKFERFHDVQRVTRLVGAVFSVVPFVSAAVAGYAGPAETARESTELTSAIESLMESGVGSQAVASEPFVDRFMRCMRDVLDENVYEAMPEERRRMLDKAITGVGMSVSALRALAVSVVGDGARVDEVSDKVDAAGVGGLEDTAADSRQSADGGHGGATDEGASDCVVGSVRTGVDGASGQCSASGGVGIANENGAGDGSNADVGDQSEQIREACAFDELEKLEKKGLEADAVRGMKTEQLALALAGFMVAYDCGMWEQFVEIRVCLTEAFRKRRVHGRRLVGKYPMSAEAFYDVVMDAMSSSEIEAESKTDGLCIREFFDAVCGT